MAAGFRGMRNDFVEIFMCIVRLPCFSVSPHYDDDYSSIRPVHLPYAGGSEFLEADMETRDAVAMEDVPGCAFDDMAFLDGGTGSTFTQGERIDNDECLDLSISSFGEKLCSTSEGEENSLNLKLIQSDSEFTPSLQIVGEKSTRQRKLKSKWRSDFPAVGSKENAEEADKGMNFDSSSDATKFHYLSEKVEDDNEEEASIQKHFSNQWVMVDDHMPSHGKKSLRDPHTVADPAILRDATMCSGAKFVTRCRKNSAFRHIFARFIELGDKLVGILMSWNRTKTANKRLAIYNQNVAPSLPPTEGRLEIVINNDIIQQLDLRPVYAILEDSLAAKPTLLLEKTVGFTIHYEREDPYDSRELSEYPDIRLWFVRLDALFPWFPVVLDWRAGELARYAAMLVPHQMSLTKGVVFNPEALELFVMSKVFIVHSWLKQQNIPRPELKTGDMARMLGFGIGVELFHLIEKYPAKPR